MCTRLFDGWGDLPTQAGRMPKGDVQVETVEMVLIKACVDQNISWYVDHHHDPLEGEEVVAQHAPARSPTQATSSPPPASSTKMNR